MFLGPHSMAIHIVMIRGTGAFHSIDRLSDVSLNCIQIAPVVDFLRGNRTRAKCQDQSQNRNKFFHGAPLPLNSVPVHRIRELDSRYPRCFWHQTLHEYMTERVELPD